MTKVVVNGEEFFFSDSGFERRSFCSFNSGGVARLTFVDQGPNGP